MAYMKTKVFLIILSIAIISFTTCTKNSMNPDQGTINLVDDDAVSNVVSEDVFNSVDYASIILDNSLEQSIPKSAAIVADSCPSVAIDNLAAGVWPKTITIDYGTECSGINGSTRSGKIIITFTERRSVVNSVRTVTFENYFFNNIKMEGTWVLTNLGPNSSEHVVISVVLTGGKLTLPDGKTIERSFEHQREWIAGWDTPNIWDDEILITGVGTGKTIDGISYMTTITSPLHWKRVCEFLVSGVIEIERAGLPPAELDYGKGDCDAIATLTIGSKTQEITLRHKFRLQR
jgi:hypothetical protein